MPTNSELHFLSIAEAAERIRRRQLSALELVEAVLARIERLNPRLNAYLTVCAEAARDAARKLERKTGRGRTRGLLEGIPVALKDNIETRGVRTTAGSKILADYVPATDAAVTQRLRRAGAILLGKTNLNEFAYGVTGENPHYGATRNPWDTERMPGGSSAGAAAAAAAGLCAGAVGTDTGGSCRIPPALCGVVGVKPTYGRVSLEGIVPLALTLDHAGPIARTVQDAALLLAAIGHWKRSEAEHLRRLPEALPGNRPGRFVGLSVGVPKEYYFERLDAEVRKAIESAIEFFHKRGARIVEVSLPSLAESETAGNHIALPEATDYHTQAGWFPDRREDYSEDVAKRLELGREIRAIEYLRALTVQRRCRLEFLEAFAQADVLLAPTVPIAAPRLGEKTTRIEGQEETVRAALLRLCRPANLTGFPAISVPCGFTASGLPIGLQILGAPQEELKLLGVAHIYEREHEWYRKHPPI